MKNLTNLVAAPVVFTICSCFTRTRDPEEFRASVHARNGKFAPALLKAYPLGDTTVPMWVRFPMPHPWRY